MGYSSKDNAYTNDNEEVKKEVKKEVEKEVKKRKVTRLDDLEKVCVKHKMVDGTVMDGPTHGKGQVCVEWKEDETENDLIEYYDDDDEFMEYVNKMYNLRNDNVKVSMRDMLRHMDKRIMYLEYKNDISYEIDSNRFVDYNNFFKN
tara:strand:- start:1274 stop:1711 length:438 start_codon:yes stop_codon:yes gene_type:complete